MDIIPVEQFGRDHWSTFAYVCSCIVGQSGKIRLEKMRSDPIRHLHFIHPMMTDRSCPPSRLKTGTAPKGHDDWDCVDDLIAAGFLVSLGTGLYPCFNLTDDGWNLCRKITEYRFGSAPGSFANFTP